MKRWLPGLVAVVLLTTGFTQRDYKRAYKAHTREMKVYFGLETALILRGTLLTRDFRDAMSQERKRRLNATETDHREFVARMQRDHTGFHEVVFSADSPAYDDHGRAPFGGDDAGWQVRLEADGTQEPLVEVYRVRKPTPLHLALYQHLNLWSELYIARFERTVQQPSHVEFIVGSGFGNGTLIWDDL